MRNLSILLFSVVVSLLVPGVSECSDGSIVAWGLNDEGQCNVPVPNEDFVAVAGGYCHSLGLKADGSIVAWGNNGYGQCNVPTPNEGFVVVAGGEAHSLGLKEDGSIVAWGWNDEGQCNVPAPNEGFVAVAGGGSHSLGLHYYNTGIEDDPSLQNILQISTVYPNPFSGTASVVFQSQGLASVTLEVYDVVGRLVKSEELGALSEGQQTILWNGSSSNGETLVDGVYLIRLVSGSGKIASIRVFLLR